MKLNPLYLIFCLIASPLLAGDKSHERTYMLILFNVTDQAKYDAFRQGTNEAFNTAGGLLERELKLAQPRENHATVGPYNRAILVSYPDAMGHQKYTQSSSYKKFKPLLLEGTDNAAFFTASSSLDTKGKAGEEAVFLIKLSWYGENADLPVMENQIAALSKELSPYGFHEDRVLRNPKTTGIDAAPDRVTVMFMGSPEMQLKFVQDKELAGKVNTFNQTWLKEAVYLGGTEVQP